MLQIASTALYTLSVNADKNRLYTAKFGFWYDIAHSEDYLRDITTALHHLSDGFTILSDLSQLDILSHDCAEKMITMQKMLVQRGCAGKAEILPKTTIAKLQVDRISEYSGILKKGFANKYAAESWLDDIAIS